MPGITVLDFDLAAVVLDLDLAAAMAVAREDVGGGPVASPQPSPPRTGPTGRSSTEAREEYERLA
ncbi:hypothetical protein ACFW17_26425 [Streptomyces sp. NPDC058961]|uniref:hypothetical protein n=1 Tax=unclassified Streptomyces TaxID=2593676 RepID=UPI0033340E27